MTFTISLEDETRKAIEILDNRLIINSNVNLDNYKLLQYLDPYGDTIFNRNQTNDLITDLKKLDKLIINSIIRQVIELAETCKNEVHTYLCFNGD